MGQEPTESGGVVQIAELTLGIEDIQKVLEEAKAQIEQSSLEIGKAAAEKIRSGMMEGSTTPIQKAIGMDEASVGQISNGIGKIKNEFEGLTKVTSTFRGTSRDTEDEINRVVETYGKAGQATREYWERIQTGAEATDTELKIVRTSLIDNEKERQKIANANAARDERELKQAYAQADAIDLIINKQKNLIDVKKSSDDGVDYTYFTEQSKKYVAQLEAINNEIQKTGKVTADQQIEYKNLTTSIKKLNDDYAAFSTISKNASKEQEKTKNQYKNTVSAIEQLIVKQKNLNSVMASQKNATDYSSIISANKMYINQLQELLTNIQANGRVTDSQAELYEKLSLKIKELTSNYSAYGKILAEVNRKEEEDQRLYKSTVDQLEVLISKQKEFTNTVSRQKKSFINKEIINDSKQYTRELENMLSAIKKTGTVTAEQVERVEQLRTKIRELGGTYHDTGTKGESFLKQISDKAKWFSAYQIVDALKRTLRETYDVIRETEDATVQLRRVLSEDVGHAQVAEELYNIAMEYGRTFNDVQDVATRFAQTGKSWQETLQATRATMLALNTAELDVHQSTEGLIAIMSQWNINGKDLELTIDKINKTADKFPVTSEKLVAALQRSSSSAKQAGLSFEETIGTIEALSKATGRSGENLGTALNSLLIYTSKPKALETFFEVGNETVKKTVTAYRAGAASILDVWKALSKNLNDLSAEQQKILYEGIGGDDFAQHLEQEATDVTDSIKQIYGTAGTFRQNYFAALISGVDDVDKVLDQLSDSAGYSVNENKIYMESLTATMNQLSTVWKSLLFQMGEGEGGLMKLFKGMANLGISTGNLIKEMGGILPVLTMITGAIVTIESKKIGDKLITPIINGLGGMRQQLHFAHTAFTVFFHTLEEGRAAGLSFGDSFGIAAGKIKAAGSAAKISGATIVGALIGITTAIVGVTEAYKEKQRAQRESSIQSFEATRQEKESTLELIAEYEELNNTENKNEEQQNKLSQVSQELSDKFDLIAGSSKNASGNISTMTDKVAALKEEMKMSPAEWQKYIDDLSKGIDVTPKFYSGLSWRDMFAGAYKGKGDTDKLLDLVLGKTSDESGFSKFLPSKADKETMDDLIESYHEFIELKKEASPKNDIEVYALEKEWLEQLNELSVKHADAKIGETKAYAELKNDVDAYQDTYSKYIDAQARAAIELKQMNGEILPDTINGWEQMSQAIGNAASNNSIISNDIAEAAVKLKDEYVPALKDASESQEQLAETPMFSADFQQNIDESVSKIEELNGAIDDVQAVLSFAQKAVDEYNKSGSISIDTMQKIIETNAQYPGLLELTASGLTINKEMLDELIQSQRKNIEETVKMSAAERIYELAQETFNNAVSNGTEATDEFSGELSEVPDVFQQVVDAALSGAISVNEFNAAMERFFNGSSFSQDVIGNFERQAADIINSTQGILNMLNSNIVNYSASTANSGKEAAKNAEKLKQLQDNKAKIIDKYETEKKKIEEARIKSEEKYKKEKEDIQESIKQLDEKYEAEKKYNAEIRELEQEKDTAQDEIDRAKEQATSEKQKIKDTLDAEKKALQQRKDALNESYEREKAMWQARKEDVKSSYDAQIDALKAVQKENSKLDAQEEYLRNKRNASKDLEKARTRSGVEYREKELEAAEKLSDIEKEREKAQRDKKIEDQIDALEKMRDDEIKNIERIMKMTETQHKAEISNIDKEIKAAEEKAKNEIAYVEKVAKEAERHYKAVIDAVEEQIDKTRQAYEDKKKAREHEIAQQQKEDKLKDLEEEHKADLKALDEKLKNIAKERDEQLKAIDEKIAAMKNGDISAAGSYHRNYTMPVRKDNDETIRQMRENYKRLMDDMRREQNSLNMFGNVGTLRADSSMGLDTKERARRNARAMYDIYKNDFVDPLAKDFGKAVQRQTKEGISVPTYAMGHDPDWYADRNPGNTTYSYDNRTNNSVTTNNIFSSGGGGGRNGSVFVQPY